MNENDEKKHWWWIRLEENFFDDDAISWLEEQENGKEYTIFYLKLCLKSLRHGGRLERQVGKVTIPYDVAGLAKITRSSADTVRKAVTALQTAGLIEIQDNETYFMSQLYSMVGSAINSPAANKKRKQRARKKHEKNNGNGVMQEGTKYPPAMGTHTGTHTGTKGGTKSHESIEYRVKSKDNNNDRGHDDYDRQNEQGKEQDAELSSLVKFYESNFSTVSGFIAEQLSDFMDTYSCEWVQKAMEECVRGGRDKCNVKYLQGILKNWKDSGYAKPWEQDKPVSKMATDGVKERIV